MRSGRVDVVESGVSWLGHVPRSWTVSPLGIHFKERKEIVSDVDFTPLSVTKSGVVPQLVNAAKTDNNDSRKLVRAGDFVINARSDRKGSSGVSTLDGSVSVVYIVLTPRSSLDGRFVHHLLRSSAFQEEFYRWGNGIVSDLWSTRYSAMRRISLALPARSEQTAISTYLDCEIARIDELIEKQKGLVDTLRTRREAVITHAVGGLDRARMPLRRFVDVIDCAHVTADFVDDDRRYPVASIRECRGAVVDLSACGYTTEKFYNLLRAGGRGPCVGDLLFVRNVSVGLVAEVVADTPEFAVGQETVLLRRRSDIEPAFLRYAMVGAEARYAINQAMIGSTFRRINVSAIRGLPVPDLEPSQQRRVVVELDQSTRRIDVLIAKAEQFITLAKERRSALITAAVTGQIDVREAS